MCFRFAARCSVPDLRYSAELWEEEEVFLLERKKVVFNALTDLFAGDSRAPNCLHEVGMSTCRVSAQNKLSSTLQNATRHNTCNT